MKGIVIATHGKLCEGYLDSSKLFFKDNLQQILACPLEMDSDIDKYSESIVESCRKVDTGEGVIILLDLLGGTPCNTVLKLMTSKRLENINVLSGVNFPMFLELLGQRMVGQYDLKALTEIGKSGISEVVLKNEDEEEEEVL